MGKECKSRINVLNLAFADLFELEERMNHICDHVGNANEEELGKMIEELIGANKTPI